uniref:Retrotransposon gag domain-containing protein n=1 Tax=Fagus sylvatica TaxID=28930 RepID=A0A2N9H1P6_FAGSY
MKEMKSQVKAKAARNLDMLVHRSESPFTKRVDDYPLPTKFKVPQLENFDGLRDPLDYLDSFRTVMRLQGVSDEIMCRAFPTNLRGSARVWFNQLETGSIDTFAQLSRAFIDNFIGGRRSARLANYLLNIQQREGESLRSYVQRFNKEAVQIDEPNEFVALTAFNAWLQKGDFLFQLCKDPLRSMSELMYEAQKFINAEDAFEARDKLPSKKRKEPEERRFESPKNIVSKLDFSEVDRKNVGSSSGQDMTIATKDPTQGKLGPTWERPYRVVKFHRRGTYHLEKLDGTALPHPWNTEHLKKYYQ